MVTVQTVYAEAGGQCADSKKWSPRNPSVLEVKRNTIVLVFSSLQESSTFLSSVTCV